MSLGPEFSDCPLGSIEVVSLKPSRFLDEPRRGLPYRDALGRISLPLLLSSRASVIAGTVIASDEQTVKLTKWIKHADAWRQGATHFWVPRVGGGWEGGPPGEEVCFPASSAALAATPRPQGLVAARTSDASSATRTSTGIKRSSDTAFGGSSAPPLLCGKGALNRGWAVSAEKSRGAKQSSDDKKRLWQEPRVNRSNCPACRGGHRAHTCDLQHSTVAAARRGEAPTGCKACAGGHRAHTC